MKKILVIEDEKEISELLYVFMEKAGYQVLTADDGIKGVELFEKQRPDLVLLDIMLPEMNGYEVCKRIRESSDVPVIMLTALSSEQEQMAGYELKIDEYVTKPFSIPILLKKIEAVLRRNGAVSDILSYKNLVMDRNQYKVSVSGKEIFLTSREFDILALFLGNPHKVFTKEMLINEIWKYDYRDDDQIIYTHMKNIRKKLGIDLIKTIRGVGYKLD